MARLNSRSSVSIAGRVALSSTDRRTNSPATSTVANRLPSPASGSEKENNRARMSKGKGRLRDSVESSPRHSAEREELARGSKRRRISRADPTPELSYGDADSEEEELPTPSLNGDGIEDETGLDTAIAREPEDGSASAKQKSVRFYDQAQDEDERRKLKREARRLEREFIENRDEYLKSDNNGLKRTIDEANKLFDNIKQTTDATTDSRLMVSVADVAYKKSAQLVLGDTATGVDVDEFISKCISFMRRPTGTQRRRRDADDDEDEADILDWAHLGTHACFPHNSRPSVPQFLLGPLSVQKRVRTITQRKARQQADTRPEVAPEQLRREDLAAGETNTVRHACEQIKARLIAHCEKARSGVQAAIPDTEAVTDEDIADALRAHRITGTAGPNLFDFVTNPRSFGQTVENLFYVSFLIKEGEVGVEEDDDGQPTLVVISETVDAARARKSTRHQAIFGLDYATWQMCIEAFEIKEPLIPHRAEEEASVGAKGWYN